MAGIICAGGAGIDRKYTTLGSVLFDSSNPARVTTHFGGVARNVAENLSRLGVEVSLLSRVGEDPAGTALLAHLRQLGVRTASVESVCGEATGEYAAIVNPDGSLVLGVVIPGAVETLDVAQLERYADAFAGADWLFLDMNLSSECIAWLFERKRDFSFKLAADGVSEAKVHRLTRDLSAVDLLFLKQSQAQAYLTTNTAATSGELARRLCERGAGCVVITRGAGGCLVASGNDLSAVPAVAAKPVDATGAGDALIAGTLYRLLEGDSSVAAVAIGTLLAALTIETSASVVPDLTSDSLERQAHRLQR